MNIFAFFYFYEFMIIIGHENFLYETNILNTSPDNKYDKSKLLFLLQESAVRPNFAPNTLNKWRHRKNNVI